jgi:hypothetical protein
MWKYNFKSFRLQAFALSNSSCISDIIRVGANRRRRHLKTMRSSFLKEAYGVTLQLRSLGSQGVAALAVKQTIKLLQS